MEAVERHRANEGGFRFETSAQLKEVEDERIRLEKERRVSTFRCRDRRMRVKFVKKGLYGTLPEKLLFRGQTRRSPCWWNP